VKNHPHPPGLWVSCRRATELASQALDRPLTRRERFALGLHTLICGWCRRYRAQLDRLREAMRRYGESGPGLSPERRARIVRGMRADSDPRP
jgi:hypothetical protein